MSWRNKYIWYGAAIVVLLAVCILLGMPSPSRESPISTGPGQLQTRPTTDPTVETTTVEPTTVATTEATTELVTEPTSPAEDTLVPDEPTHPAPKPTTKPTDPPEPTFPKVEETLKVLSYGRYSGKFVEDGTDEHVQNVAVILVKNNSENYLDYAQVVMDIGGKAARFVATGIPPGKCAWVLENSRMSVEMDAEFVYADSSTGFKPMVSPESAPLTIVKDRGQITVTNTGSKKLPDVWVYFKVLHNDGNYLGGITYRVSLGDIEPGATSSALAGHFDPDKAEIVRITWNDE